MKSLIFVLGVPGSGKTTFSKQLVPSVKASYICSDTVYEALTPSDRTSPDYLKLRPKVYDIIYGLAEENLRFGNTVVVDAPHVRPMVNPEWRSKIADIAERSEARLKLIRLLCSEQKLRERIERRALKRDDEKLQNWEAFLKDQPIKFDIPLSHIDIDTEKDLTVQMATALRFLAI